MARKNPAAVSDLNLPIVIATLFSAAVVFFARVLFTADYVIPWDFSGFHLPLAAAMFDAFQGHGSLLWDPGTYCGRPLFADPQAQVFYPPTVVAVFVASFFDFSRLRYLLEWELVLHVFAAGAFTFLMLRKIGLSRAAALLGGLVFELGGFFSSETQHFGAIDGAAWIPLMWASVLGSRQGMTGMSFAGLETGGAMAILAGFPAVSSTAIASTILLLGVLLLSRQMGFREAKSLALALALSAGLAAIILVPAIQLMFLSVAKYRTDWFDGWGLPLKDLTSLFWPPNHAVVCDLLYCGTGGFCLAIFAIFSRGSRRQAMPFVFLTVLSGIWMLGNATVIGRGILLLVPRLLKGSLYPHFGMITFCLGIAALAGIGLDGIRRFSTVGKYSIGLLVAADLILAGSGRPMNTFDVRTESGMNREQIDGSRATLTQLRQLTTGVPPGRFDTHAMPALFSTTAPLTQLVTAGGYNPMALERLMQVRLSFAKGDRWGAWYEVEDLSSPVVDALNIRYLFSSKPIPAGAGRQDRYALIATLPGFLVYENRSVLPRAWMVHQVELVHSPADAFDRIHRADFQPSRLAIVECPESGARNFEGVSLEGGDTSSARERTVTLAYRPREVTFEVSAATPAFLATSEVDYPGWHVYVDGSEASLYTTNAAFRGVLVPAGKHVVDFRFAPRIVWLGAAITGCCLMVLLVIVSARSASRELPAGR